MQKTKPEEAGNRPVRMFMRVVLPAPKCESKIPKKTRMCEHRRQSKKLRTEEYNQKKIERGTRVKKETRQRKRKE